MSGEDFNILKNNCQEYAKVLGAVDVLRNADGKRHYTKIAEVVGIHKTTTSGLLKKAEKLGLARKISEGVYKKNSGVLTLMPKIRNKKTSKKVDPNEIIKKLSNKRSAKVSSSNFPPKISGKVAGDLTGMTKAFGLLYITENTLRQTIRNAISNKPNWWINHIPSGIQKEVSISKSKEAYHAAIRNDELEYTHLGQLKEIIINKKNWSFCLPYLKERSQQSFSATIDKAIPSRNAIAHSIPLKKTDLKVVDVRFEDILKMIK